MAVIRRRPAWQALAEWEAREIATSPLPVSELVGLHGISRRTVYRYKQRAVACRHCGDVFVTRAAAWDHLYVEMNES